MEVTGFFLCCAPGWSPLYLVCKSRSTVLTNLTNLLPVVGSDSKMMI